MEKSKDVKRRHRKSKGFRFTASQIARMDRADQREDRARQVREKDARRIANKKKKAEAEAKARSEWRARGIPDPNTRLPSSQPRLLQFFSAKSKRHQSPESVEASGAGDDMDLPGGAILSTDRVVLPNTTDWDCFDLWTDGIDGCGFGPKVDTKEEIVTMDSSDDEVMVVHPPCGPVQHTNPGCSVGELSPGCDDIGDTYLDIAVTDVDEADESNWRSSPPVCDFDVPVTRSGSHVISTASVDLHRDIASTIADRGEGEVISAVQDDSPLSCRPSPTVAAEYIPPSNQHQLSPLVSTRHISPGNRSPIASSQSGSSHFASSQFDPTDFLIAEATAPVQPTIAGGGADGVRRLSVVSSDLFCDDTAGWMEDIFVNTHGHPFSDDRPDVCGRGCMHDSGLVTESRGWSGGDVDDGV